MKTLLNLYYNSLNMYVEIVFSKLQNENGYKTKKLHFIITKHEHCKYRNIKIHMAFICVIRIAFRFCFCGSCTAHFAVT